MSAQFQAGAYPAWERKMEELEMKTLKYMMVFVLLALAVTPVMAAFEVEGNGPGGGGDTIPDTGELYGDLYVILRDEYGIPILSDDGCIQPISTTDGTVEIETDGDPLIITVYEGEPFGLPTYTDAEGDLVECELTEAMSDWVQGVDFGRLNLGRSPQSVIDHAFDEAINKMNAATAISIDPAGRLMVFIYDAELGDSVWKTIDAPAENLALYIKMMLDGHWMTATSPTEGPPAGKGKPGAEPEPRPVLSEAAIALLPDAYKSLGDSTRTNLDLTNPELQLAASLLAAAADKTGRLTLDKVVYINSVYGINQAGNLPGEIDGKTYFNFGAFTYDRGLYNSRSSGECDPGWIWVLQPVVPGDYSLFAPTCMDILGYDPADPEPVNAVHFNDMEEAYTTVFDPYGNPLAYEFNVNVRGFTQAADDALQVLEYIHNYKVPEELYPPPSEPDPLMIGEVSPASDPDTLMIEEVKR